MRNLYLFLSIVMIFVLSILGCSGHTPVTNPIGSGSSIPQITSLPVGVTDYLPDGAPSAGMGTLGLFNLHVDPLTQTAEMESLRRGVSTDVLEEVDLTNFLRMAPCTNCVKIKSVALNTDGNIVVSIGIRHPFPAGDPFKPITGKNRADLHVFNIEGTVISNAPTSTFSVTGEKVAGFRLVNADGYSKYLDNSIDDIYPTDATVHPYITHFDDYSAGNFNAANPMGFESVTTPPPSGNLVMPMGSDYNLQDYVFALDGPTDFIFAVGCTYAISAETKSKRFNPEYRCPQHNKKAASEVALVIISNDLAGGNASSNAQVEVHIVDISNGVAVGEGLDQMKADSSVGSISIEVPGVTSTPVNIPGSSSTSGTGHSPSDALVYPATITNTAGAAEGVYPGLIKVIDTYSPGQNGTPSLNGKDGIKRVDPGTSPMIGLFDISEFVTYQYFEIEVLSGNEKPSCDLQVSSDNVGQGATITANPGASSDPDGSIISYEYDKSYGGTTFTADITQHSGDPDFGNPVSLQMPCNTTAGPIINKVALRVCDNGTPSGCTICTKDITVNLKLGSPGDVTVIKLNRGESGANPQLITSLDLDWADNPCNVAEYAIERGDGWNGTGWIVIGTSTTSDFKYKPDPLTNDLDEDYRLRVIARAVVGGDPLSDSDPSEEVFVLFLCNAGWNIPENRWSWDKTEGGYNGAWGMTVWSGGGPNVDGWMGSDINHRGYGPVCWDFSLSTFRWSFARTPFPVPDLVGEKEAFCDGYYQLFNNWPGSSMGLCLGTLSIPNPPLSQSELFDFEPANDGYGTGIPYNTPNIEGLNHEFGETDQAGFTQVSFNGNQWAHMGFYLNDLLDPDRDYIAIGLAIGSVGVQTNCVVGWSDGWVFIVD